MFEDKRNIKQNNTCTHVTGCETVRVPPRLPLTPPSSMLVYVNKTVLETHALKNKRVLDSAIHARIIVVGSGLNRAQEKP